MNFQREILHIWIALIAMLFLQGTVMLALARVAS